MTAVFKKEFSSAFHKLYTYIVLSVMLLAIGILFAVYNLSYTAENILSLLSFMSVVAALVLPVLAINVFPSRKKEDTDSVYALCPLKTRDMVLGKFFAVFAIIMLPNILVAILPAIAGMFGGVDHKASYSALLGYVLFEAALLAFYMFIAKASKNRIVAYILSYVIIVVWYLSSLVASIFGGVAENIFDALSIFEHFNYFVYGLFDIESIVFFVMLCLLFVFLTWRSYETSYKPTRRAITITVSSLLIISTLAIQCAAIAVPDRYTSFDSTGAGKNSVSPAAKEFLGGVDEDVTIYLLESTGSKDYELYLSRLSASNPRFTLEKIYYADTPEFYTDRALSTDSISANSLVVQSEKRMYYISYFELFYYSNTELGAQKMSYTEYQYYYSMFSSNAQYMDYLQSLICNTTMYFDADATICSYIEYVTADIIPASYYLSGHGEIVPATSASPFYGMGLEALDISNAEIPNDAASILINMPNEDISEQEKAKLLSYLEGGGQLTFITNEANLDMPNLCALLSEYGMSAQKGSVKETIEEKPTAEFSPAVNTNNDILYYFAEDTGFSPTVTDANAITLNESAKAYLTLTPLFSSSDKAFIGEDSSKTASYTLAAAAETPNGAKIVWFTGGESMNDVTDNAAKAALYALIGWVSLKFESELGKIPAVIYNQPMTPIGSGANIITVLLILIPIAVCVCGIIYLYKRKKA